MQVHLPIKDIYEYYNNIIHRMHCCDFQEIVVDCSMNY